MVATSAPNIFENIIWIFVPLIVIWITLKIATSLFFDIKKNNRFISLRDIGLVFIILFSWVIFEIPFALIDGISFIVSKKPIYILYNSGICEKKIFQQNRFIDISAVSGSGITKKTFSNRKYRILNYETQYISIESIGNERMYVNGYFYSGNIERFYSAYLNLKNTHYDDINNNPDYIECIGISENN